MSRHDVRPMTDVERASRVNVPCAHNGCFDRVEYVEDAGGDDLDICATHAEEPKAAPRALRPGTRPGRSTGATPPGTISMSTHPAPRAAPFEPITITTRALHPGHVVVDYRGGRHVVSTITGPTDQTYTVTFTDGEVLPFGIDAQVSVESRIVLGTCVRLNRDVTFSGRTFPAGEFAVVTAVHCYPPGVVDGDHIYEAAVVDGVYVENTPAFGITLPLTVADVDTGSIR